MIWEDKKIRQYCEHRGMVIPYEPSLVNPASIDLRLGNELRKAGSHGWMDPIEFEGYVLGPGDFVLCHSLEYVTIPVTAAGVLYSKSSTGRIGLEHLHAGYIDPNFCGQLTFEFHNVAPWPITLKAGMRVMQMVLHDLNQVPLENYETTGRYQRQTGPTVAREEKR
jgi:dCTP deaminase